MSGGILAALLKPFFRVQSGTLSSAVIGAGTPQVTFETDGQTSGAVTFAGSGWGTPLTSGVGVGFWVLVSNGSGTGTNTGATRNVWLQLSSARTFSISPAPGGATRSIAATWSIATDAAGANIVGSGALNLTADNS